MAGDCGAGRRLPPPLSRRTLRRPAAAGGVGPSPCRIPGNPSDGRAVQRRGRDYPPPAPAGIPAHPHSDRHYRNVRHPRHQRGPLAGNPYSGDARRPHPTAGNPGGDSLKARHRIRPSAGVWLRGCPLTGSQLPASDFPALEKNRLFHYYLPLCCHR